MTGRLHGKAALITGAASGIGHASALLFAAEGARIVVCDINADGGEEVAQAIRKTGGDAEFIHADVTDEQDVARAFAAAAERTGRRTCCTTARADRPTTTRPPVSSASTRWTMCSASNSGPWSCAAGPRSR